MFYIKFSNCNSFQVILLTMEGTKKSESSHYSLTFQVIGDLVHDFMNFNALKIILKIHKKITNKRVKDAPKGGLCRTCKTCNLGYIIVSML